MKKVLVNFSFFVSVYVIMFPPQAHAYLDPGTGSYILQVVAAVFFGSLFALKVWWRKVANFLGSIFGRKEKQKTEKDSNKKN